MSTPVEKPTNQKVGPGAAAAQNQTTSAFMRSFHKSQTFLQKVAGGPKKASNGSAQKYIIGAGVLAALGGVAWMTCPWVNPSLKDKKVAKKWKSSSEAVRQTSTRDVPGSPVRSSNHN